MHGNTPYYAYWPAPGGTAGEVNGDNSTVFFMHKDWLGSSRLSSTIINHTIVSDQAYAPYGEVYNKQSTGAGQPGWMFTGDTQDILAGLFDTPNRELNPGQGRWLSPDPAGSGWNQYAYPTNPNSFVDTSGLFREFSCGCFMRWGGGQFGGNGGSWGSTGGANLGSGNGFYNNNGTVLSDGTIATIGPGYTGLWGGNGMGNCSLGCVSTSSIDQYNGQVVGGSASDLTALGSLAATMFSFGDLTTSEIAVIGKLADTNVWSLQGYKVFQMSGTIDEVAQANAAWVEGVIANGEPVIVASDLTYANIVGNGAGLLEDGVTTFGGELGSFLEAGYEMGTVEEAGEILLVMMIP
jgi:RHS repeat-associated protein